MPAAFTPGRTSRAYLLRIQRRVALLTVGVPTAGLVPAALLVAAGRVGKAQLAICAVMYALTMIGTCVGFHRLFTHRSFRPARGVQIALAAMGSMAGQGPLIFWVATHRKHHHHSDGKEDPHSPAWGGLWHAHVGWMFSSAPASPLRYAPDLLKDKLMLRLDRGYPFFLAGGLVLPALAGWLLIGGPLGAVDGLVWGGLVRAFVTQHVTWCVNSVCHAAGARPYGTRDRSGNVAWLALPTFGEAWHNNHHAFPSAAFHGLRWFEVDLSAWVIRALRALGWADAVVEVGQRGR